MITLTREQFVMIFELYRLSTQLDFVLRTTKRILKELDDNQSSNSTDNNN